MTIKEAVEIARDIILSLQNHRRSLSPSSDNDIEYKRFSMREEALDTLIKYADIENNKYEKCPDCQIPNELWKPTPITDKDRDFALIKSIISDCICKSVVFVGGKIPETALNLLANEYANKICDENQKEKK